MKPITWNGLAAVSAALFLAACLPAGQEIAPNFQSDDLSQQRPNNIVALPAVDQRVDRSIQISSVDDLMFEPQLGGLGAKQILRPRYIFRDKGYAFSRSSTYGRSKITPNSLASPTPSWIRGLGPDSARWVYVVVLRDLASGAVFGKSASSTCSGYLFDKASAKLVWRHDAGNKVVLPALLGEISGNIVVEDALLGCNNKLVQQLPSNKG